ncbi:MAG: alpha/beta hydrolase [Actinomycetota bacterium]
MSTVQVNGVSLHYTDQGEGDPVLLIHGLGSSGADWEMQIPALIPDFRVIAVDLRGHGQSDKPDGPYSIAMFAGDVAAVIEELGIAPCHVVGLSLGGITALELAATRPELVRRAVIVNAGPEFVPKTFKDKAAVWQRRILVKVAPLRTMGEIIAERTLPEDKHAELRERVAETIASNDKAAYQASMKAIVGWSVLDRLNRITSPILVVASEFDYSPSEAKQPIVDLAQDARMVVVPETRHLLPVEKPREFNKILQAFLSDF